MVIDPSLQDWDAAGHAPGWAEGLLAVAPWVFLALVVALLLQAWITRHRYRAVEVLTEADQERVRAAIREVEDSTSGDIVPLVVERSDPQTHAWLLGGFALAMLANVALIGPLAQLSLPFLALAEAALLAIGLGVARLCPDYRRWFLGARRADATAGEQATIEFAQLTQGRGPDQALVLLFVSLYEHRVVVLASQPVAGVLAPERWPAVVEAVLSGVRRGRLADGLVAGVQACGAEMQRAFPAAGERDNHFADRAIVRRE